MLSSVPWALGQSAPPEAKSAAYASTGQGSYDSTMVNFEAETAAAAIAEMGPVEEALAGSQTRWERLLELLEEGKAAMAISPTRQEAATKLITNHDAVLRDVTNKAPHTQLNLARVEAAQARAADRALQECARRLISSKQRPSVKELKIAPVDASEARTWAQAVKYLDSRIQSRPEERPGRPPDMSEPAAEAMRDVLQNIWWMAFQVSKR